MKSPGLAEKYRFENKMSAEVFGPKEYESQEFDFEILGFHGGEDKILGFLGCCSV
jgi:hypothetical protein